MQLFYAPQLAEGHQFLDEEESRHCIKVLRKSQGDNIKCIDGKGTFYYCEITNAHPKKCELRVLEKEGENALPYYLHIAIAPTKNIERIEWFVEKAVEIGISEISFIRCHNSERSVLKIDRLQKKAISAAKQSIKARIPIINNLISMQQFIDANHNYAGLKLIAYVDFTNPMHIKDTLESGDSFQLLIGPEGDFSKEELELALKNNYRAISLGNSRLRTETAGIYACSICSQIT